MSRHSFTPPPLGGGPATNNGNGAFEACHSSTLMYQDESPEDPRRNYAALRYWVRRSL